MTPSVLGPSIQEKLPQIPLKKEKCENPPIEPQEKIRLPPAMDVTRTEYKEWHTSDKRIIKYIVLFPPALTSSSSSLHYISISTKKVETVAFFNFSSINIWSAAFHTAGLCVIFLPLEGSLSTNVLLKLLNQSNVRNKRVHSDEDTAWKTSQ